MNIKITTFTNPFSFFCVAKDFSENCFKLENHSEVNQFSVNKNKITEANHGQYVAVMWENKWTRGIVSMEKQFLIWLIDYGIFLRPSEKTVFIDLPLEYRKLPTKVFEASIHGVVPIDKILTDDCQIKNKATTSWTQGCIEKSQQLIKNALRIYFQPIALLTTLHNHVVIGDLFLEIQGKGVVNIIDELESWPVFLAKNQETYITIFTKLYVSRRRHRACLLKPDIPDFNVPEITLQINLQEYEDILETSNSETVVNKSESLFEDTEILSSGQYEDKSAFKISPSDIEKYSNSYVTLNGKKYNVLSVLINKARDLSICEHYKDYDLKSVGRGYSYRQSNASP
ncbi:uncharacterized protein LOC125077202 isoform X2 [Vanessa atalanta]|uniref:uncharacterized protein LOC125077202 isoform X2 n=1 Tax=Vanessa atalanta TaxID=42275 RepID=UPI001FCDBA13|nr:uncharacterized protein LOC125077202 isoform X2 [Vanessa atalanta]